jgi:hypothetical protein
MATETSCISHPARQRLVVLREDYLALCEGNHCAAALLNFFEHGHNRKLANQRDALHANEVAERHGEPGRQTTSLLQFHTQDGLEQGLLGLYQRSAIRKGLDFLVRQGCISIHKNPNPRYHFDKTHYFLFHPEVVQPQLIEMFDESFFSHGQEQNNSPSEEKLSPSEEKLSTRSEITPEITDRDPEIPPVSPQGEMPLLVPVPLKKSRGHNMVLTGKVESQRVLTHLNIATGKHFREPGEITGCLKRDYTVGQLILVIDWWKEVKTVSNPDQLDYFDQETPFRKSKFPKYLAAAEVWDREGRPMPIMHRLGEKEARTARTTLRILESERHARPRHAGVPRLTQ